MKTKTEIIFKLYEIEKTLVKLEETPFSEEIWRAIEITKQMVDTLKWVLEREIEPNKILSNEKFK